MADQLDHFTVQRVPERFDPQTLFEHNSLENKYFILFVGWDIYDQHRRDQTKFGLILIITGNVIDVPISKSNLSVCAGYLAMGNGLFCINSKTKQQNNKHIK